jgi:hypothetical protein
MGEPLNTFDPSPSMHHVAGRPSLTALEREIVHPAGATTIRGQLVWTKDRPTDKHMAFGPPFRHGHDVHPEFHLPRSPHPSHLLQRRD